MFSVQVALYLLSGKKSTNRISIHKVLKVPNRLLTNDSDYFQFLVSLVVTCCRELDKKVRSKLAAKMIGDLNDTTSLLAVNVSMKSNVLLWQGFAFIHNHDL